MFLEFTQIKFYALITGGGCVIITLYSFIFRLILITLLDGGGLRDLLYFLLLFINYLLLETYRVVWEFAISTQ